MFGEDDIISTQYGWHGLLITFCSLFTELVCLLQTAQASFHGTWRHKFSKYEPTFG